MLILKEHGVKMVGFAIAFLATVFNGECLDLLQVNFNFARPGLARLEVEDDIAMLGWNVQSLVFDPG